MGRLIKMGWLICFCTYVYGKCYGLNPLTIISIKMLSQIMADMDSYNMDVIFVHMFCSNVVICTKFALIL